MKKGISGLKFRHFCFCFCFFAKFCNQTDSRVLISNMTIIFLKFLFQKYLKRTFLVPNLDITVFRKILQIDRFEDADSKYGNSFFQILTQKYPTKIFLVPNLSIFIFSQNFQIPVQKYRNHVFLVPNLRFLVLHQTLQQDKFKDADFKYDNNFLKLMSKKYPNKAFWVPISGIFIFSKNFAIRQIPRS